jgi:hypothetical protein
MGTVVTSPAWTVTCVANVPLQLSPTVALLEPPLNASTCSRRCGLENVYVALVAELLLKLMLFVRNFPYGPDRYQMPFPQSTSPEGYCPFSGRFGLERAAKVMVWLLDGGVEVGVGVGVAVAPDDLMVGVAVGVKVGVGVLVWELDEFQYWAIEAPTACEA